VIDWPNAIVGFVLGIAATCVFWAIDRRHAKRLRRLDALDSWKGAAKEIELLLWSKTTTSWMLYEARVKYPIDTWRSILGPDDFRSLEEVENAFQTVEHLESKIATNTATASDIEWIERALPRKRDAIVEFANRSRRMQSAGYHEVVTAEQRRATRRDLLHHPIRTTRRLAHNKEVRKSTQAPS
jgi:hypothetical protein